MVKIDDPLLGAKNLTHVRVGVYASQFVQPAQPLQKEGKFLFYLVKHPTANFLMPRHPSVNLVSKGADEMLRRTKLVTAAIADPVKALKADDKEARARAACALALHYRRHPSDGADFEEVARPEEESKLLLEVLAEAEWTMTGTADDGNPFGVVGGLKLDGFKPSLPPATNRNDYAAANQKAFKEWLAGKGKDARVKQLVPKK